MDTGQAGIEFQHRSIEDMGAKSAIIANGAVSWGRSDLHFILDSAADAGPWDITADTKMVIKNDGKVGIGTTAPGVALDVNGTVNATKASSASGGTTAVSGVTTAMFTLPNTSNAVFLATGQLANAGGASGAATIIVNGHGGSQFVILRNDSPANIVVSVNSSTGVVSINQTVYGSDQSWVWSYIRLN